MVKLLWPWNGQWFGETSIGLDEMASVLNGSHRQNNPLLISDDLTGWKATIGANGMVMVFGEAILGPDVMAIVLNGCLQLSKRLIVSDDFSGWKQPSVPMEWQWFSMVANHCIGQTIQ